MYTSRVKKLLQSASADAILITSPESLYYFSGFTGGEGALLIDKDRLLLFTDSRYTIQARAQAPDFSLVDVAEKKVSDFLKETPQKVVGLEEDFVTFRDYLNLKKAAPHISFVPIATQIETIRMIKDETELAYIRQATKLADDAFSYILPHIAPGKTEREIALMLEFFMRERGAQGLSFETIAASGARSAMPHGIATDKKLEIGDFLTIDYGCKVGGYCSDMTRTVVLGKASEKQKQVYQTVLSAQESALFAISAGKKANEIDAVARDFIKDAGFGNHFGHGLGHGVGLKVHEAPSLSPRCEHVLCANELVTVEPGIYIENFGGVRIEDLVIVKENGYENLVTSTKELIEL